MSTNAVVVADDNAISCSEIVEWLKAHEIAAYGTSDSSVMGLIEGIQARIVICRPGSTGIALFHALQEAADPPLVVLLSEAASAKDEVYYNGRLLVVVIRAPVQMAPLARFIKSVLGIASRLDSETLAALAVVPDDTAPTAAPTHANPLRLRLIH